MPLANPLDIFKDLKLGDLRRWRDKSGKTVFYFNFIVSDAENLIKIRFFVTESTVANIHTNSLAFAIIIIM